MTPTELTNNLFEKILTAQEMLLRDNIKANTVVLNGNKYAKWVKSGYRPTVFGMAVDYENLPKDYDFFVQYREPEPETNADRIRSYTDEELATWLNCMQSNAYHCGEFGRTNAAYPYDNKAWLDWLKEEAE